MDIKRAAKAPPADSKKASKVTAKVMHATANNKRAASEPAEPPFSKRLGDIFMTENKLEEMSQKIERLDEWRKHILNCREFLTLPDSQRVLRVASSMGWRRDRYLAEAAGIKAEISLRPPFIQSVMRPLLEKACFPAEDEVYAYTDHETAPPRDQNALNNDCDSIITEVTVVKKETVDGRATLSSEKVGCDDAERV
jgi:hypothetical protein